MVSDLPFGSFFPVLKKTHVLQSSLWSPRRLHDVLSRPSLSHRFGLLAWPSRPKGAPGVCLTLRPDG